MHTYRDGKTKKKPTQDSSFLKRIEFTHLMIVNLAENCCEKSFYIILNCFNKQCCMKDFLYKKKVKKLT
jgi:hypothetical protein